MCRTPPEVLRNLNLIDLFLLCFIIGFALLSSQRLLALPSQSSPVTKFGGSWVLALCCTLISLCHTVVHYVSRTRTPQDPRHDCARGCFDSASQSDATPPSPSSPCESSSHLGSLLTLTSALWLCVVVCESHIKATLSWNPWQKSSHVKILFSAAYL